MTLRAHVLAFLGYGLLALILSFPLVVKAAEVIPMPWYLSAQPWIHDHWFTLWLFWLWKQSLIGLGQLPLFTDEIFFPAGVHMPWATTALFPLLASIPFQISFGLILGSNLLLLCCITLAGYASHLLVYELVQDRWAACLAGCIFGFSPFMLAHLQGHDFIVIGSALIPLYSLFLMRMLRDSKVSNVLGAAALFWMTLVSTWYYMPFLVILTAILFSHHLFSHREQPSKNGQIIRLILFVGIIIAATLPIVVPTLRTFQLQDLNQATAETVRRASPDLLAFFIPSSDHLLLGPYVQSIRQQFTGDPTLQSVFLGYTVLFLAGFAVLRAPRREIRPWLWSMGIFFLLALGPTLHINGTDALPVGSAHVVLPLPSALLGYMPFLPYLGGGTVVSLFTVMVMLSLAVLAGYGLRQLSRQLSPSQASLVASALCSLVLLEFAAIPFPTWKISVPDIYQVIKEDPDPIAVLELPFGDGIKIYQYYQTVHGKKLMHGWLNRLPLFNQAFGENIPLVRMLKRPELIPHDPLDTALASQARDMIRLFKWRYIVLHKDYLSSEAVNRIDALLRAVLPVRLIAEDRHIIAFQIVLEGGDQIRTRNAYEVDFGGESGLPVLLDGWSTGESSDGLTFAWSNAQESSVWFDLPHISNMKMELRLSPFQFASSSRQEVKISMNGAPLSDLELEEGWHAYSVDLPRLYIREGINTMRFQYRYTASPLEVMPGSKDPRRLAVAFDYLILRPE